MSDAQLTLSNPRQFAGDQRLGSIRFTVDGAKVCSVLPGQQQTVACTPGRHVVRARQWWFASPEVLVEVSPGPPVELDAEVTRRGNLAVRILRLLFAPGRGITLQPAEPSDVPGR